MASAPAAGSSSKVLVVGSAQGKLRQLFTKVASIHAKTPFTFAICTGDLVGDLDDASPDLIALLAGDITIPLECFFVLGGKPLPSSVIARIQQRDGEVCPNLIFLGERVIRLVPWRSPGQ